MLLFWYVVVAAAAALVVDVVAFDVDVHLIRNNGFFYHR